MIARLLDCGAVAVTAEAIGAAEGALDLTVRYAKQRIQFDEPIGRFQGVKHPLAEHYVEIESVKSLLYYAAWMLDEQPAEAALAVSRAKAWASDAFAGLGIDAVGLHGGHRLHLGVRRAALPQAHEVGARRVRRRELAPRAGRRPRRSVMDFNLSPAGGSVPRRGARLPRREPARRSPSATAGFLAEWSRKVREKRWVGFSWPEEVGGGGGSLMQQVILKEEMAKRKAPPLGTSFMGLAWVGPAIIQYGSDEQKRRFIPDILDGKLQWCTGYSEPGSGSDLASLQCKAVRDGEHYVVNGQKIWTSVAMWAKWMILLVRTQQRCRRQARRHHLPARRDAHARDHGAADPEHVRLVDVRRGLLRRRARPGREPAGRGGRGLEGDGLGARLRALEHLRGLRPRAPARRHQGAREALHARRPARVRGSRASAAGSPAPTCASRRCA